APGYRSGREDPEKSWVFFLRKNPSIVCYVHISYTVCCIPDKLVHYLTATLRTASGCNAASAPPFAPAAPSRCSGRYGLHSFDPYLGRAGVHARGLRPDGAG